MSAVLPRTTTARPMSGVVAAVRKRPTLWAVMAIIVVWVVVWAVAKGHNTLVLAGADLTHVQRWLGDRANDLVLADASNPFIQVTHWISTRLRLADPASAAADQPAGVPTHRP